MRTSILLGMLILSAGFFHTTQTKDMSGDKKKSTNATEYILTVKKKITRRIINTRAPFIHFCLNVLGLGCIVKGAGVHVPVVRSCVEIKRVNFYYLAAGKIGRAHV